MLIRTSKATLAALLPTLVIAALSFGSVPAHADGFAIQVPSEAQLPDGSWIEQYAYEFDVGSSFPWHYHPGPLWITVTSGTLIEERGCDQEPEVHETGTAFTEEPGVVHRVFNYGTVPATLQITGMLPQCYGDPPYTNQFNDSVFVAGPHCDGRSGRARREHVPLCPPQ